MKAIYFLSILWLVLTALVTGFDPGAIAIIGIPSYLGLFIVYMKTGRFLLPPKSTPPQP